MRTVSTWSLHRTLGRYVASDSATLGGPFMTPPAEPSGVSLLELPAELKKHGYEAVQIVHFHIPSRSPEYLAQLRRALEASEIQLETLLIDDGDLTDLANIDQVEAWIEEWLGVAVALGAKRARLMAGRSIPTPELIVESAQRLVRLAEAYPDVRIVTENWMRMLPDAETVLSLFEETGDAIGLLIDLGNWSGPGKYDELARIAPLAETCHAKCHFPDGELNAEDYRRTLTILKEAGFTGPLSLIYDGPDADEWSRLDDEYAIVQSVFR
ncbi:MAG: sugar phosphate isomerase/epimerase family protein [Thermomicrobiales bacterium]